MKTSPQTALVHQLKASSFILCTIESCTGGLIANWITDVSGASEVYWGSIVAYDNSLKEELGVPSALLKEFGAVSKETACSLAENGLLRMKQALIQSHSSPHSLTLPQGYLSLATTGIAGPTGGSSLKPVGLCYIALAISGRETQVIQFQAQSQERIQTKFEFAQKALELALKYLNP